MVSKQTHKAGVAFPHWTMSSPAFILASEEHALWMDCVSGSGSEFQAPPMSHKALLSTQALLGSLLHTSAPKC